MGKIYIVGLGPGAIGDLTLEAVDRAKSGLKNFIRTDRHPVIEYFKDQAIEYESFDRIYEEASSFEVVYETIAEKLMDLSRHEDINYFTPGSPMVAENVVKKLLDSSAEVEVVSGLSFIEPILELVKRDPVDGLQFLDALDLSYLDLKIDMDIIITQVYNFRIASEVKLILGEVYGDEYQVYFIQNAGIKGQEVLRKLSIYELDRVEEPNLLTSLYIPRVSKSDKNIFDLKRLFDLVSYLRSENGCPYDRAQSMDSIKENLVEEAFELIKAVESDDIDNIVEEVGDVLLQVIFYSIIGEEEGIFNIGEIMNKLGSKLIYRHPHVFLQKTMEKSNDIVYNWDRLKNIEKNLETHSDKFKHINGLPALIRGHKIIGMIKEDGFTDLETDLILDELNKELLELRAQLDDSSHVLDKDRLIGSILSNIIWLSKVVDINPEISLGKYLDTFIERVEKLENESDEDLDFKKKTLGELKALFK